MQRSSRSRPTLSESVALPDTAALRQELSALAAEFAGNETALRAALTQRLKRVSDEGRRATEEFLLAGGKGRAAAERLSQLMDLIIVLSFEVIAGSLYRSSNPSDRKSTRLNS